MTDDARGDADLVAAARTGDHAAFEALYRRHRDWVVQLARRLGAGHDDALDVLQDAFAYLLRRLATLELQHSLPALLYPVIKHMVRDRRARAARWAPLASAPQPEAPPSVLPGLPDDVRGWLGGLTALQQEVLSLRYADDLELREIAAALDVPLGTVKSRLHDALAALRQRL